MAANPPAFDRRYTVEEYLALDADYEGKLEYYDGEIVAMAGASPEHVRIVTNLIVHLHRLLSPSCQVYSTDLRVKVQSVNQANQATNTYYYPDVTVTCGKENFSKDKPRALYNPTMIIEVLSRSTAYYDAHQK